MENSTVTPPFDFRTESEAIKQLIAQFSDEQTKVTERRTLRKNRKNVIEEREKGTILNDETIIPDRTINTNIRRGRVPYISFVTQSKRTLIITEVQQPAIPVGPLEEWFTRGMRFPKWKLPWIKAIDCMQLHGGGALEVMYDESKPLNCVIEYIPREDLIFLKKSKDLQANPRILRRYELTSLQLDEFASKYQFNPEIVERLKQRNAKDHEKTYKVYRVLTKKDGFVYNCWYCEEDNPTDWLRGPQLHDIGLFAFDPQILTAPANELDSTPLVFSKSWMEPRIDMNGLPMPSPRDALAQPLPLALYPLFWFPLEITEDEQLLESQGRAALDIHVQEAMTCMLSDTVNATHRAAQFFPSAEAEPGADGGMRELGPLKHGVVMDRKISVFQPNWPNPILLAVSQALRQGKAEETGNMDYAAVARKDANKTATEMELSTQQTQDIQITDMDVFSSPYLDVYALCFNIATHQALFHLCTPPTHPELLLHDYTLTAAGDVEVVKREEAKRNAKEFFNIVKGTPTAEKILVFLIQQFFPDHADEWIQALSSPDKDQIIIALINALQNAPQDGLTPEQKLALSQLIAAASAVVEQPDNQSVSPSPGDNEKPSPAQSNEMPQSQGS